MFTIESEYPPLHTDNLTRKFSFLIISTIALYYLVGMLWYFSNMGGSGLRLPQNIICWGAMASITFIISLWFQSQHRRNLCQRELSFFTLALILGCIYLTLPITWSPSQFWQIEALPRIIGLWGGVLFYLVITKFPLTDNHKNIILWIILASVMCQTFAALIQSQLSESNNYFEFNGLLSRPYGIFQQPNLLASFSATGLGICLYLFQTSRFKISHYMTAICLIIISASLSLQQSRIGWFAAIVVVIVISLCFIKKQTSRTIFSVSLILLGVLLALVLSDHFTSYMQGRDFAGSTETRFLILKYAISMIIERPIFGWGYGGFESQFADHIGNAEPGHILSRVSHPHNEFLFVWIEGGIIAIIGVAFLALWYLEPLINRSAKTKHNNIAVWGLSLPIVCHLMTELPLYQSAPHFLTLLLLCRLAKNVESKESVIFSTRISYIGSLLISVLSFLTIFIMIFGMQTNAALTKYERNGLVDSYEIKMLRYPYVQWERYQFDRHIAMLIEFNSTRNLELLENFWAWGIDYISVHNDSKVYSSLIAISRFKHDDASSEHLLKRARMIFPGDPMFN